jgi:hypothetical protein
MRMIGPGPRTIAYRDRICTLEFDNLGDAVSQPYAGEFAELEGITAFLIESITHGEEFSYPHLGATTTRREERIEAINKSLSYLFFSAGGRRRRTNHAVRQVMRI